MGVIIYIAGEIETNASKKAIKEIREIEDAYGNRAFTAEDRIIYFQYDQMEGNDPIETCVLTPLRKLAELAKTRKFSLDGSFEIHSDWSDHDNVTVVVTEHGITTHNTQIYNAGTDELLRELERRGVSADKDNPPAKAVVHMSADITTGADESRMPRITNIKDETGVLVFTETSPGTVHFFQCIEGGKDEAVKYATPIFKKLVGRAKQYNFSVEGRVEFKFCGSEEEDITMLVSENGLYIYPSALMNASTEDLCDVLNERGAGYVIKDPKDGRRYWTVSRSDSQKPDTTATWRVYGNKDEVVKHLAEAVKKHLPGDYESERVSVHEPDFQNDGSITAYSEWSSMYRYLWRYKLHYRAVPEAFPTILGKTKSHKKQTWLISRSDQDCYTDFVKSVYGTKMQVKKHLSELVDQYKKDKRWDCKHPSRPSDVMEMPNGKMTIDAVWGERYIQFDAVPDAGPTLL